MTTRNKVGIFKPKIYLTQCKEYRMEQNTLELNNVLEALSNKDWRRAMEDEYNALIRKNLEISATIGQSKVDR